jgi:DNA-binding NarL/FixJ family response regulator
MVAGTVLVVITTNAGDTAAIAAWLGPQLREGEVVRAAGYFAAVSALQRRPRAVVIDVGFPEGRDDWRLAELRAQQSEAAFVVVADATLLPRLAATTRADLAVTSAADLPPLRELLLTDEPIVTDRARSPRASS